jgi:parallel beta-helix repeat protein
VDAGGMESAITLNANGITVESFTATNASGGYPKAGILVYSNNNTVINCTARSNYGIILFSSSNSNTLTNNTASNNSYGIYLSHSSNSNTLTNNTASNNSYGIYLDSSSNNNLTANKASNNCGGMQSSGIYLDSSSNNSLSGNTVINNDYGIYLYSSSFNNNLTGNTVNSNNYYGIFLKDTPINNLIYNNYFNNTNNAWDNGNNIWNIPKTPGTNIIGGSNLGGNYWSDYTGGDTSGDGLGDSLLPYNSSGHIENGGDWLPLVRIQSSSLTGMLSYACNGTGIAEVTVNLTQTGSLRATTASDAAGQYSFTNLSTGAYAVNVSKRRCFENSTILTILEGETAVVNLTLWLKGDLNSNCVQADAGDLAKLKDASVGKIGADWMFDLNSNSNNADAGDLAKLKDASVGKIDLV